MVGSVGIDLERSELAIGAEWLHVREGTCIRYL